MELTEVAGTHDSSRDFSMQGTSFCWLGIPYVRVRFGKKIKSLLLLKVTLVIGVR